MGGGGGGASAVGKTDVLGGGGGNGLAATNFTGTYSGGGGGGYKFGPGGTGGTGGGGNADAAGTANTGGGGGGAGAGNTGGIGGSGITIVRYPVDYAWSPSAFDHYLGSFPTKTPDPTITAPIHDIGDLLLAFVYQEQTPTVVDPSGWTRLFYVTSTSSGDRGLGVWSRTADGTASDNATFDFSFGAASGVIVVVVGGGTVKDYDDVNGTSSTTSIPSNDKSMTSASGDLAFYCICADSGVVISDAPGSVTDLDNDGIVTQRIGMASEVLAGAVGTGVWTVGAATAYWITGTVIVEAP